MVRHGIRFVFFVFCILPTISAADVIDVLVVFEETAWANTTPTSRQQDANRLIDDANAALAITGYAGFHTFRLANLNANAITPMPHRSDLAPDAELQLNVTYANTSQHRNTYAADVILLVSEHLTKNGAVICGGAVVQSNMPVRATNADLYYAAAVRRSCIQLGCTDCDRVAIHELGHLLSAEHEQGTLAHQDSSGSAPVTYNHPTVTANHMTIMGSGLGNCPIQPCTGFLSFSTPQATFPGTPILTGHSFDRDNKRMIDEAFPVIARYRAPPVLLAAPERPTCFVEYVRCSAGRKEWIVSWEENGQAQPFAVFDVDYTYNPSGGWSNFFDGGAICAPTTPSTHSTIVFRARVSTSYGLSPYCQVSILGASCTDEDRD